MRKKKIVKKKAARRGAVLARKTTKKLQKVRYMGAEIATRVISKTQKVFVWVLIAVALGGVFSIVASYSLSGGAGKTLTKGELPAASTLNADGNEDAITLTAVGDIMLARYIEEVMRKTGDYAQPLRLVADILKSSDITFGNLESPFFPGLTTIKDSMVFRADPASVKGLLLAGFDVLSLANNHSMNYQAPGLNTTLAKLAASGILTSGAGKNLDAAHTPAIVDVKGKRLAFYSYVDPNIPPKRHGEATEDSAGVALMDIETVKRDVGSALNFADYVIVSMHAGREYTKEPTQFQRDFAHAAIDAGASIVIGSHPHVVQPVERYEDGVIFYSLGNFVFDQFFSEDVRTGLMARITLEEDDMPRYELFPVRIDSSQTRITEGKEREELLKKMGF